MWIDGLRNVFSGLGGKLDKSMGNSFVTPFLDDNEILNAYRGSAIAKKIVDIPALDACREWREWSGTPEQIVAMAATERKFGIRNKVRQALILARLYGGAAILIGNGDENPEEPLDYERMGKDGLRYLTVLSKNEITAGPFQRDAYAEGFNRPEYYNLSSGLHTHLQVHPSRLAIFTGAELPDKYLTGAYAGWGDSVLLAMRTELKNLESSAQNIAHLVAEAKIDVIKIPDLSMNLQTQGKLYETDLERKLEVVAQGKGNFGIIVMDGEEEYEQKKMAFATLPDILDRFMQLVGGGSDIPGTRLFGTPPTGLNATGESDLRNYYDRIGATQTLDIEPAMQILDECLIRTTLGSRPEGVDFIWRPLWQMGEKEKAETGKLYTDIIDKLSLLEIISDDALVATFVDVLTGSQIMPGLAAAVEANSMDEKTGEEMDEETDEDMQT